jgi:methylmalonyl-CoA mutase, C-terminal domain
MKEIPMTERRLRILVGKPGLDGHDRGAKIIARAFRDAGFEVIYTGLHQTPEQIVSAAIQEDVDCIGLSILSGAHNTLLPRVSSLLKDKQADDIIFFAGGVIPADDIPALKAAGVTEVFTPGSSTEDIVDWVRNTVHPRA